MENTPTHPPTHPHPPTHTYTHTTIERQLMELSMRARCKDKVKLPSKDLLQVWGLKVLHSAALGVQCDDEKCIAAYLG